MSRVCGPILGWRGQDGGSWRVSVMVAHRGNDAPGALSYGVGENTAEASAPTTPTPTKPAAKKRSAGC